MRWNIIWSLLLVTAATGSIGFMETEGGSSNLGINVWRNPFPINPCSISATIYSPEYTTYYTNQILLNYSYTGNNTATTCIYRIIGYGWNNIPCNGSITRTFQEGTQTLELRIFDDACSGSDTVTFEVNTKNEALTLGGGIIALMAGFFILSVGIMWLEENSERYL
jgi:hypothetical protein